MVAFFFLFAPTVVLIAVLLLQRFQPSRDPVMQITAGRVEPQFAAAPEADISVADVDAEDALPPAVEQEEAGAIPIQGVGSNLVGT
jgi:hypothetical protein